jgi:HD-GYP domain-containing protein (c-di-GMP phosphodiesterase class II)
MLSEMNFPKRYGNIPGWASSHHEFLNGKGYPDKLAGSEIPIEVRMLTIIDIYDALTARDRPYKPALPIEKAFGILTEMAAYGQIDERLLLLFKQSEVWKET